MIEDKEELSEIEIIGRASLILVSLLGAWDGWTEEFLAQSPNLSDLYKEAFGYGRSSLIDGMKDAVRAFVKETVLKDLRSAAEAGNV